MSKAGPLDPEPTEVTNHEATAPPIAKQQVRCRKKFLLEGGGLLKRDHFWCGW